MISNQEVSMKKGFLILFLFILNIANGYAQSNSSQTKSNPKVIEWEELPFFRQSAPDLNYEGNTWGLIMAGTKVKVNNQIGYVCPVATAAVINKNGQLENVQWMITIRNEKKENLEDYRCSLLQDQNGFICDGSSRQKITVLENSTAQDEEIATEACKI